MSLRQLISQSDDTDSASSGGDGRHPVVLWLQSVERDLWVLAVTVMLIDVTLTVHGLTLGLKEQNPVARWVLAGAGALGLYGLKASALLVGICCRALVPRFAAPFVPLVLAVPSAIAVCINATMILSVLL